MGLFGRSDGDLQRRVEELERRVAELERAAFRAGAPVPRRPAVAQAAQVAMTRQAASFAANAMVCAGLVDGNRA